MSQISDLYPLQKNDLAKASAVMAEAFREDPVWLHITDGFPEERTMRTIGGLYKSSFVHCLRYGSVYATSADMEAVIAWVPGDVATMTIGRQLRSGSLWSGLRAAARMGRGGMAAARAMALLPKAREANMAGREYVYLQVLGVPPHLQGTGLGGQLLQAMLAHYDEAGVPVYTETTLGDAVGFYQRYGFDVINEMELPVLELPVWEFLREPVG